ncbi:MAG: GWxTD domain-containing protein, partial [Acidobacteriota bacterium]
MTSPRGRRPALPGVRAGLLLALLMASTGCRILARPNPQLPPEMRPPEGPRAAAAETPSAPGPAVSPGAGTAPSPPPPGPQGASSATPVPAGNIVALPPAPRLTEGKSGRLFIEPVNPLPPDASTLTPLPDDPEFRRGLAHWDRGPARYILLKEEQDLFRQLTTDEDRLYFIQGFWARRDRAKETPENEYRQEFWRRVSEANRRFIDSAEPGWKSDRGRIWIVLGPPDDVENYLGRQIGTNVIRWFYRQRPNLFLSSNFIVAFRRDDSGAYQLSNDLRDFDRVFRDLEQHIGPPVSDPQFPLAFPTEGQRTIRVNTTSRLALFLDLGQAAAPPELYRRMGERESQVETQESFGAMDVRTSFEFLGQHADGTVRTGVVVGVLKGSLVSEIDEDEADSSLTIDMSIY